MNDTTKAPLAQVKQVLAQVIEDNPTGSLYTVSVEAFEAVYNRRYVGKDDRTELERIKHHARKLLAGETVGEWGGTRPGAGIKKAQEVGE